MPDHQDGEGLIPLFSEELGVSKRVVETGRVAVTRVTREQSVPIVEALAEETVDISREPIGRYVETMPPIRQEGDTLVVPIVEEQLVIERRLFLKEEVHVRRVRATHTHRENVTLRHHEVVVSTTRRKQRRPTRFPGADNKPPCQTPTNNEEER